MFICTGLVLGAEELKPVQWRVWAGKIEREGGDAGPFLGLEERVGFVDIRVRHLLVSIGVMMKLVRGGLRKLSADVVMWLANTRRFL